MEGRNLWRLCPWIKTMSVQSSRPGICIVIKLQAARCVFKPISTYWDIVRVLEYFYQEFFMMLSPLSSQTGLWTYQADKSKPLINTESVFIYTLTKNRAILFSFLSAYMPVSLRYFSCFLDIILEPSVHYGVQTPFT